MRDEILHAKITHIVKHAKNDNWRQRRPFYSGTSKFVPRGDSGWLDSDKAEIYLRQEWRQVRPLRIFDPVLTMANVNIRPQFQCQGIFPELIYLLESFGFPVFIENITHKNLVWLFERHSYQPDIRINSAAELPMDMFKYPATWDK